MDKFVGLILFLIVFCTPICAQKMAPEDILAKHLDSVGSASARQNLRNITAVGEVSFAQGTSDQGGTVGKAVLVSEGPKMALGMSFPIPVYPFERIISDGKSVDISFTRPGLRSALGEYLLAYKQIISDGLFTGTLSRDWTIYSLADRKPKLSGGDIKKINGREVYVISYSPRKGSDLTIRMYFDKETFHHVRTEYFHTISAQMGATSDVSASQTESHENMSEDFGDFQTENGITLPRSYKITLFIARGKTSRQYFYDLKLNQFFYNQTLDSSTFKAQ
jgi:outer membrane lipoprotein-sorting protein